MVASQRNVNYLLDERFDTFLSEEDRQFKHTHSSIIAIIIKTNKQTVLTTTNPQYQHHHWHFFGWKNF